MTPEEFWAILHDIPAVEPIRYRLYYNEHGEPLFYTMDDLPGNYIDIDQETFSRSSRNVRVKNGKLITTNTVRLSKLIPGNTGTSCDPRDVCVIIDKEPNTCWSLKTYE